MAASAPKLVPLRQWARENNIDNDTTKLLERNGVNTLDDMIRLLPDDLKSLNMNLGARNRVRVAMTPYWGIVGAPKLMPADLTRELEEKLNIKGKPLTVVPASAPPTQESESDEEDEEDQVDEAQDDEPVVDETPASESDSGGLQAILDRLPIIRRGPPTVYKLPVREIARCNQLNVRKCECGENNEIVPKKSILMIGETGSGKSTMIDSLLNYIMGVQFSDNHRFELIDTLGEESPSTRVTTDSQTDWVTTYTIHHQHGFRLPCTLNIVDTPGYGDTRGMDRDRKITEQIKQLFTSTDEYGLDTLDAVCFVMKSSGNRVTLTQKYIIDSVLTIFGKDVKDNIFIMMTFCDDASNPVLLDVLNAENVPFTDYYALNNQWMGAPPTSPVGGHYYDMCDKAYKDFFEYLKTSHSKSLKMTVEVLQERRVLEERIEGLARLISSTSGQITNSKLPARDMKSQTKPQNVFKTKLDEVVSKQNNFNCSVCKASCKINYGMFSRFAKLIVGQKSKCDVCGCGTDLHVIAKLRFQWMRTSEADEEEKIYEDAINYIDEHKREMLKKLQTQVENLQQNMQKLNQIALRPQLNSTGQHVEIIMEKERIDKKPGYEDRVKLLAGLKDKYDLLAKIGPAGKVDFNDLLKKKEH